MELGLLKDPGLTDWEVLASATNVGANILGIGDKLADILIVGANPLKNIQNLRDVKHVIADGRVVR